MTLPDWSFSRLEELIESRGDTVIHETGSACPVCQVHDVYGSTILRDGVPATISSGRINCPRCYGVGWIYRNPQSILGLVTSVQSGANKTLIENGWAVPGDAVFSPSLNELPLSDFDRITMCHPVPVGAGETIIRGSANMEDNAGLDTGLTENQDRLWYIPECTIWCEDEDGVAYTQDVDFTFDEKIINWTTGPAIGKVYVLKYFAYPEWIVFASPFTRFDNNRSLGQKVLIRKSHVAFVNAHEVDTPAKREEEYTGLQASLDI